ncbi:MAG TPA: enolase C-terminal domain-like protein [Candidatus Eisenbacteria bacterium]|nr:enolase C-terminal domain-like protein [Candidatus Eisenbacteria bacterium]
MDAPIRDLQVSAYTIPTESPESDGTLVWDSTTLVLVQAEAGGKFGTGYTYAAPAAARVIRDLLTEAVLRIDAMAVPKAWDAMARAVRNVGRPGIASMAIAAVDTALWDLKARLLGVPLVALLGSVRDSIPVYGSGGFTSYSVEQLRSQLQDWAGQGIARVKMKVGRNPAEDVPRVQAAREAIGDKPALFVDANGAYSRKQALDKAARFADFGVCWFEEPVSSDDLEGLRLLRDRAPAGMDIAAGEYGYDSIYFRRMLEAGAVDCLQADATRCAGITGFLAVGALCQSYSVALSAHTAPALHLHPCCALPPACHVEYFFDHVRIERMFFDGCPEPSEGSLRPDLSRPGLGLEFRKADANRFEV